MLLSDRADLTDLASLFALDRYADTYLSGTTNKEDRWFVDPYAGPGWMETDDGRLPGAPLHMVNRYGDQFDRFYFFENNERRMKALVDAFEASLDISFTWNPDGQDPNAEIAEAEDPYILVMDLESSMGLQVLSEWNTSAHWLTYVATPGFFVYLATIDVIAERGNLDLFHQFPDGGSFRHTSKPIDQLNDKKMRLLTDRIEGTADRTESLAAITDLLQTNARFSTTTVSRQTVGDESKWLDLIGASEDGSRLETIEAVVTSDSFWEDAQALLTDPVLEPPELVDN